MTPAIVWRRGNRFGESSGSRSASPLRQPSHSNCLAPTKQKFATAVRMRDQAFCAGNFQEAYRRGIAVLDLANSVSAPDGLLVADSKVRLAMILEKLDRAAEAATNYEQACPVFLAKASDNDTRPGLCQHAQAMVLLKLDRAEEAKPI